MNQIAYVSKTSGPHDQRFVNAWKAYGFSIAQFLQPEENDLEGNVELISKISELAPDAIQIGPLPFSEIASQLKNIAPTIATSWGSDLLPASANLTSFKREEMEISFRFTDWLLVDTFAGRDVAISLGMTPERISVFPWGVENSFLENQLSKNFEEVPATYICTRAHEPIYNVSNVFESFMRADLKDSILVIGGDGSLTSSYKARCRDFIQTGRIRFVGALSVEKLHSQYKSAQFYISSSSADGSSVSLLEAMALGCVPIVSNIPGNLEWVSTLNGIIFESEGEGLCEALRASRVMDPQILEQKSRNSAELVRNKAKWGDNSKILEHIFSELTS